MLEADSIKDSGPQKIGGWLILLAIGLVFTPIRLVVTLLTTHFPIITSDSWALLTTESSQYYIFGFGAFLIAEIIGNLLCLVLSLYLIRLFFNRQQSFPKWYIGTMFFYLVFITLDSLVGAIIVPNASFVDKDTIMSIFSCVIALFIWGTYLIKSQRSKNTFIMQAGEVALEGKDKEISTPASQDKMGWQGVLGLALGLLLVKVLWEIVN